MRNGVADLAVVTQGKGSRAASGIVSAKSRSTQVADRYVTRARSQGEDLVNEFEFGCGVVDLKRAYGAAGLRFKTRKLVRGVEILCFRIEREKRRVVALRGQAGGLEVTAEGLPVISVDAAAGSGFGLGSNEKEVTHGFLSGVRPRDFSGCRSNRGDAEEFSSVDITHC